MVRRSIMCFQLLLSIALTSPMPSAAPQSSSTNCQHHTTITNTTALSERLSACHLWWRLCFRWIPLVRCAMSVTGKSGCCCVTAVTLATTWSASTPPWCRCPLRSGSALSVLMPTFPPWSVYVCVCMCVNYYLNFICYCILMCHAV